MKKIILIVFISMLFNNLSMYETYSIGALGINGVDGNRGLQGVVRFHSIRVKVQRYYLLLDWRQYYVSLDIVNPKTVRKEFDRSNINAY